MWKTPNLKFGKGWEKEKSEKRLRGRQHSIDSDCDLNAWSYFMYYFLFALLNFSDNHWLTVLQKLKNSIFSTIKTTTQTGEAKLKESGFYHLYQPSIAILSRVSYWIFSFSSWLTDAPSEAVRIGQAVRNLITPAITWNVFVRKEI